MVGSGRKSIFGNAEQEKKGGLRLLNLDKSTNNKSLWWRIRRYEDEEMREKMRALRSSIPNATIAITVNRYRNRNHHYRDLLHRIGHPEENRVFLAPHPPMVYVIYTYVGFDRQ